MEHKYINIISNGTDAEFLRQLDPERSKGFVFTFEKECIPENCDVVVVLHRSGLSNPFDMKGRNVPSVYVSLEPNELPSEISRRFLNQFTHVWSSDTNCSTAADIKPTHTWWLGINLTHSKQRHIRTVNSSIDFDYLSKRDFALPDNKQVLVISSKKQIYSGHARRKNLIQNLLSDPAIADRLDIYGQGYQSFEDKFDLILKYKYVLVIENECKDDYWTEKIADALLLNRQIIYVGCKNIDKYFPDLRAFTFDDESALRHEILKNGFCSPEVSRSAKKLVLYDYNITNHILNFIDAGIFDNLSQKNNGLLKPNSYFTYRSYRIFKFALRKIVHIFKRNST